MVLDVFPVAAGFSRSCAQALMCYTPYAQRLRELGFSGRVRKVTLNGGFTCPNIDGSKSRGGCTFCDNRSFSPVADSRGRSIPEQLEQGIAYSRKKFGAEKVIAYFQTYSGTYAPVARLRELYTEALSHPDVVGLSIGTRPDCVDDSVADLLEEFSRKTFLTLELGLQSVSDLTLMRINRAHTFEEFSRTMDRCQNRNFDLCIHVILGLPGETPEHWVQTAASLNRWKYHGIKIHPLHVVKGTVLGIQYARGEYQPLEIREYVNGLVDFLELVPRSVGVQRFTGDAPSDMLLAPLWCREKSRVRESMLAEFSRRGSHQGCRLKVKEGFPV